ncbi:hypothetical protein FEM48_Zijuj07G0087100 [Ziziphus jujuba var. spinosa]|uniref:DUF569 domain-containing protein n=1 Tax=Ziziphus jujuba var. spinosa TaxID=714518 RepID=A0A978V3M4_ZIZJJ|nr:hypothetical protein FEM48_Zijuj07G0087100 [Ziziphus jujuba var. spinosa]
MEFFHKAKVVRLYRPPHGKYLIAQEDQESVKQDRNGSSRQARWTVEFVPGSDSIIRLRSCYDKYLTASNQPFLIGLTGRQVLQTLPARLDSPVEWEPIKCGNHMRLRSRFGHSFLRANGSLPPWRNTVTHFTADGSIPNSDLDWDAEILEIHKGSISSFQYAMAGLSAGNLGVGLVNLMPDGADANGHLTGVADTTGVSDATGVADAAGVMDPTGVADVTTAAAGGIDAGGLAGDIVNMASNCPVM